MLGDKNRKMYINTLLKEHLIFGELVGKYRDSLSLSVLTVFFMKL